MSYARWGNDSDVYVYADTSGGVTCCLCRLSCPSGPVTTLRLRTPGAMRDRLLEHVLAGHKVPPHALAELEADMIAGT